MRKIVFMMLALSVTATALGACQEHRTFGQKVQDAIDPPKGPIQKAGRAIDRATGD